MISRKPISVAGAMAFARQTPKRFSSRPRKMDHMRNAIALRHVHFEDLGTFEPVLSRAGYKTHYCDLGTDDISALDPLEPDLVMVLGGPIGVYETSTYPFLG